MKSRHFFPLLITMALFNMGCQLGYIVKSANGHFKILNEKQKVESWIEENPEKKEMADKLRLAVEAKKFAEQKLGLKKTDNYEDFVELPRPYVSYILRVSEKDKLEAYTWWFPFVGSVPYKGYFSLKDAKRLEESYKDDYDTYVRGATAYSTLGWFDDPILSSMTRLRPYDLVNLIIHETVHATIYIKGETSFNERLATYLGDLGAELFYKDKEGENSPTLQKASDAKVDDKIFTEFISAELDALKKWYEENKDYTEETRQKRLQSINENFKKIIPQLKTKRYLGFANKKLNNANLMSYRNYNYDLSDFQKVYEKLGRDFAAFLKFCKSLEKEEDPEEKLKSFGLSI